MNLKIIMLIICFSFSRLICIAQIEGSITDAAGKAVANAKLTALDADNNISDTASSDYRGLYSFANLKKGFYTIRVTATGFEPAVKENVKVIKEIIAANIRKDVSSATRLNIILKPLKAPK